MKFKLALLFVVASSLAHGASFDVSVEIKYLDLGQSKLSPSSRDKLTCFYYDQFMVKQIDLSEKGADQLSIIPFTTHAKLPACQKKNVAGEMIVDPKVWSGYFKGVKSHYVFFDGDDGWNGATPFAIFDARTGKKIFDDASMGEIKFIQNSTTVGLTYRRAYQAPCSVVVDGKKCWEKIMQATGIRDARAPDCAAAYRKSNLQFAHNLCEDKKDFFDCFQKTMNNSQFKEQDKVGPMIEYPVEIRDLAAPKPKALSTATACWPPS